MQPNHELTKARKTWLGSVLRLTRAHVVGFLQTVEALLDAATIAGSDFDKETR